MRSCIVNPRKFNWRNLPLCPRPRPCPCPCPWTWTLTGTWTWTWTLWQMDTDRYMDVDIVADFSRCFFFDIISNWHFFHQSACFFPVDVLSHSPFLTIRPFVPFDVFSIRSFVPFGVFSIQCFVPFCVLSYDVLSFDVLSFDILYFRCLLFRHFVGEPT